jgi:Domain of unknown function (DUF4360)
MTVTAEIVISIVNRTIITRSSQSIAAIIHIHTERNMKIAQTLASILLFTSAVMTTFSPAFADDPKAGAPAVSAPKAGDPKVEIQGNVAAGGSGCPEGSVSATVSPDGQELSVLFDKFIADTTKTGQNRKKCDLAIPVKVPQGFQVSLYTADFRGYVAPATTGKLKVEYFFAGNTGTTYTKELTGEIDYTETQKVVGSTFSACGDSVNMRMSASMVAKGKGIATVDSLDLAHQGLKNSIPKGLVYHLKYQPCPAT